MLSLPLRYSATRKNPASRPSPSSPGARHRRDHGNFQRRVRRVLLRPLPYPDADRIWPSSRSIRTAGRRGRGPELRRFRDRTAASRRWPSTPHRLHPFRELRSPRVRLLRRLARLLEVFVFSDSRTGLQTTDDAKKGAGPTVLSAHDLKREVSRTPQDLSQSHLKIAARSSRYRRASRPDFVPRRRRFVAAGRFWRVRNPSRTSLTTVRSGPSRRCHRRASRRDISAIAGGFTRHRPSQATISSRMEWSSGSSIRSRAGSLPRWSSSGRWDFCCWWLCANVATCCWHNCR